MSKLHELKTWPQFYAAVLSGRKSFEVRKDDRGFQSGDVLLLREWDPVKTVYTGAACYRRVRYVLSNSSHEGIAPGHVVMAISNGPWNLAPRDV